MFIQSKTKKVYDNVIPEIRDAESQIFKAEIDDNGLFMGEENVYDAYYRNGSKHSTNQLESILMGPQYANLRNALTAIAGTEYALRSLSIV
jgi:hypothetical protein